MPLNKAELDGAVRLLLEEKLIEPAHQTRVCELLNNLLSSDYVPRNPLGTCGGTEDMVNFRKAPAGMRCARPFGYDPQSGPFYCGQPAVLAADSLKYDGALYVLCSRHAHHAGEGGRLALKGD